MKKKITMSTAVSFIFIAMTVTFCLTMIVSARIFEKKVESVNEKESMYNKISDIDQIVRQNYFADIDDDQIYDSLSAGYVAGLNDTDSKYYSAEELESYEEVLNGKIIGIGVDIAKSKENSGYMLVYNVYTDSPADVQGIEKNDLITSINGTSTINMTVDTAKEMLSGLSGSSVDITYMHDNSENSATVVRKAYDAPTISYSNENEVGYIKVSTFSSRTASELEYAANNLINGGAIALAIDLRDNSGKNFDNAAAAADVLLKEGTTMYALYQNGDRKVLYTSDKTSVSVPIVIITNGQTGYAAELFCAMLKDVAGAKTVGTVTMGKGTLQKMFKMSDGSGVELSVAVFDPVSFPSYNGTGIIPDYEKALDSTQEQNYYNLTISEDPQIQRAIEVARNQAK